MPNRRWTEEQIAEALALAAAVGPADAARQLGIPEGTIKRWRHERGERTVRTEPAETGDAANRTEPPPKKVRRTAAPCGSEKSGGHQHGRSSPQAAETASAKVVALPGGKVKGKPRGRPFQPGHPPMGGRPPEHGRFSSQVLKLLGEEDTADLTGEPDLDEQIRIAKAMIRWNAKRGNEQGVLLWQDHLRKLALAKVAMGEAPEKELHIDTGMPGVDRHASR